VLALRLTGCQGSATLKDGTYIRAPHTRGATCLNLPEDSTMAKALLGHLGGTDPRMLEQVRLLNRRVADLEAHVIRLQAENDHLVAAMHDGRLLTVDEALRAPASV
jgi:hypothetical protein